MSRALGCLELSSIARGVRVLDAIVKRAPVTLRHHARHSPGKYVILFEGTVADVEESYGDALMYCEDQLLDRMLLAQVHDAVWRALDGDYDEPSADDAVLLVETAWIASSIEALDFSAKFVEARVVDWQLGNGIGGKGYFAVQAPQHDLEVLQQELRIRLDATTLVGIDLIARPHVEMLGALGHEGPFQR